MCNHRQKDSLYIDDIETGVEYYAEIESEWDVTPPTGLPASLCDCPSEYYGEIEFCGVTDVSYAIPKYNSEKKRMEYDWIEKSCVPKSVLEEMDSFEVEFKEPNDDY